MVQENDKLFLNLLKVNYKKRATFIDKGCVFLIATLLLEES